MSNYLKDNEVGSIQYHWKACAFCTHCNPKKGCSIEDKIYSDNLFKMGSGNVILCNSFSKIKETENGK